MLVNPCKYYEKYFEIQSGNCMENPLPQLNVCTKRLKTPFSRST